MRKVLPLLPLLGLLLLNACRPAATRTMLVGTDSLPSHFFTIDVSRDTVLHTPNGALLTIPAGAFAATGTVELEIKEAYSIADMIRGGLVTQSNEGPLSSGGMIYIGARGGQTLRFRKPVKVSLPTSHVRNGMKLYKGGKDKDGKLVWTGPTPLAETKAMKAIAEGKELFSVNCSACHAVDKVITGPALAFIPERRDKKWLRDCIHDYDKLARKDGYARCLYEVYNKTPMSRFPALTDKDIDRIVSYIGDESTKLDSDKCKDFKRSYDSCALYNRLKDSLEERRALLMIGNGPEVVVKRYEGKVKRSRKIDTSRAEYIDNIVAPVYRESEYYQFTVTAIGWYNVDCMASSVPGAVESSLSVRMQSEYKEYVSIFLVLPDDKVLAEGGLLKNSVDTYGFWKDDGRIFLPQNKKAYILAMGEYKGQVIFGKMDFMTSVEQHLNLDLSVTTKEKVDAAVAAVGISDLTVQAKDSKNAASIRKTDTALAQIERLKPRDCNCNCGVPQMGRDTAWIEMK